MHLVCSIGIVRTSPIRSSEKFAKKKVSRNSPSERFTCPLKLTWLCPSDPIGYRKVESSAY